MEKRIGMTLTWSRIVAVASVVAAGMGGYALPNGDADKSKPPAPPYVEYRVALPQATPGVELLLLTDGTTVWRRVEIVE